MKIGDFVKKKAGYHFAGTVIFIGDLYDTIGVRVLVKQADGFNNKAQTSGGAIHIFSPEQLEIVV